MLICEPICMGYEHAPFNAMFISKLARSYPRDKELYFLSRKDHWDALKVFLDPELVDRFYFIEIESLGRSFGPGECFRQLRFLLWLNRLDASKGNDWLFLCPTRPFLWLLSYMFRSKNAHVVMHSLLAEIDGWVSRNPITRFFSLRNCFKYNARRLPKLVVLEHHIYENLISFDQNLVSVTSVCPHPLPGDQLELALGKEVDEVITFPGVFCAEKGADVFIDTAKRHSDNGLKFTVAGKNGSGSRVKDLSRFLFEGPFDNKIPRDQYASMIIDSKFLFICHDEGHYKWTASGALMDVIHFEKPIIAKKTQWLESLTEGRWDIGYFFENEQELEAIMVRLRSGLPGLSEEYLSFQKSIKKIKSNRANEFDEYFSSSEFYA